MIRTANMSDLPQLVHVHHRALPHTAMSLSGEGVLSILYRSLLRQQHALVMCSEVAGNIVGVVSVATAPIHLTFGEQVIIGWHALRYPLAAGGLYDRLLALWLGKTPYPQLLTLVIDPQMQAHGYGRELLSSLLIRLKKRKLRHVFLDTQTHNHKALHFYAKMGFEKFRIRGRETLLSKSL